MIASVQRQTLTDWELVVVDDGSTDDSAEIVATAGEGDARIRLIRQPNGGVCRARNTGFAAISDSEYVLFLDADDLLLPEMLAVLTSHLDAHPDVGLAYCAFRLVDGEDQLIGPVAAPGDMPRRPVPTRIGVRELPASCPRTPLESLMAYHAAYPSMCVMRRSIFGRTTGWDPSFRICEDKDMVLQMAMLAPVHFVARHLVLYRRHETNVTAHASVVPSLRDVHAKWWNGSHLTSRQRADARRAILFDRRVASFDQLADAVTLLRAGAFRQSTRQGLRGSRALAELLIGYASAPGQVISAAR
jgi:glycosyltransferase involved in cell wall biosynthesis